MPVIFDTEGEIDPKAFSTFGLNSKPNSDNPIGFFGTGLKYAIAVLVRCNVRVQLFIGETEYEFYTKEESFRDKDFGMVRMKRRKGLLSKWTYEKLPFTTELGKQWELWQAFRELESNTRDEGGRSYIAQEDEEGWSGFAGKTFFILTGDKFQDVYLRKDEVFLPEGKVLFSNERIQVLNQPSNYIYFRGLRVMDLKDPSLYTYNILSSVELTEDRTIKYEFMAKVLICTHYMQSEDGNLISQIVSLKPDDKKFEASLEFDTSSTLPGTTFMSVIASRRRGNHFVSGRATTLHNRYDFVSKSEDSLSLTMKRSKWAAILKAIEKLQEDYTLVGELEEFAGQLNELVEDDGSQDIPF